MPLPMWEVDVPIHHSTEPRTGVHVFTGRAADPAHALAAAHAAYDTALLLKAAGCEIPASFGDGWAARGLRPGWVLDWDHAATKVWTGLHSLA